MEESNWGEAVLQGPEIPNRNPQSPENRKKINCRQSWARKCPQTEPPARQPVVGMEDE